MRLSSIRQQPYIYKVALVPPVFFALLLALPLLLCSLDLF